MVPPMVLEWEPRLDVRLGPRLALMSVPQKVLQKAWGLASWMAMHWVESLGRRLAQKLEMTMVHELEMGWAARLDQPQVLVWEWE